MSSSEQKAWIKSVAPLLTDEQVQDSFDSLHDYFGGGYSDIHRGTAVDEVKAIDRVLTSPDTPIFSGDIYRGLEIIARNGMSAENEVKAALAKGNWNESGITSFSSKKSVAERGEFGNIHSSFTNTVSVILHGVGNLSGVPVQHMSGFGAGEAEVLMPSSIKDRGWKITGYKRRTNSYGHVIYRIDIKENRR